MRRKSTFCDVIKRLISRYREGVLDEIAEDVEKFIEARDGLGNLTRTQAVVIML